MKFESSLVLCVFLGAPMLACSDDADPPVECTLPQTPRFDFTEIDLEEDRSNEACPEIAPDSLDTEELSERGVCEQKIVDCVIRLTCKYEGLIINGRMGESNGGLSGRFDIETPITCVYAVKAEWKEADGG